MRVPVTIVEVPPFPKLAEAIMPEDDLDAFKTFIASNPEAGVVIQGTGGLRKVRWRLKGRGKSGGARVIYYFQSDEIPIFLLTVYAKSRKTDLTAGERAALRALSKRIIKTYQGGSK